MGGMGSIRNRMLDIKHEIINMELSNVLLVNYCTTTTATTELLTQRNLNQLLSFTQKLINTPRITSNNSIFEMEVLTKQSGSFNKVWKIRCLQSCSCVMD